MKILIACEYSGIIRNAFAAKGHDAWSCDLLPTESDGNHIQGDALPLLRSNNWDLVIAHPPCSFLSASGYHHRIPNPHRIFNTLHAAEFFMQCYLASAPKVCIENPAGIMSAIFREPDQTIHPHFFGESQYKRTCLWLRGLPRLVHLKKSDLFSQQTHVDPPDPVYIDHDGKHRYFTDSRRGSDAHGRSRSFASIANAMAQQWG